MVREDQVQRRASLRLVVIVPLGVIPAAATSHLFRRQAEQEEILLDAFLRHLDGRAVAGADRQCPVHHKFHVARAAGFISSGGDLIRNVGRGINRSARETQYSGRNRTFSRPRIAGSPSMVRARLLMNLMMTLASW